MLIRGIAGKPLGNFFEDLTRAVLRILLPISVIGALVLASQGVVQSLDLPVASQEIIKVLGTNGGGFFNVNSAMPFENPNGLTNFLEMLAMLAIPASLTYTYGRIVGSRRQGWTIFGVMFALFAVGVVVVYLAELQATPAQQAAGLTGANLEGKELRFGTGGTALWTAITTATSTGAVNSAFESLTGIGGLIPMVNMAFGESRLRRRRHRPLHDAALRPARRVHRRADGRPHAGVPRQEARGARDQARRARAVGHAAAGARRDQPGGRAPTTAGVDLRRPARRASPSRSTPTCRRPTTTAPRSRATRATSARAGNLGATASRSPTCSADS